MPPSSLESGGKKGQSASYPPPNQFSIMGLHDDLGGVSILSPGEPGKQKETEAGV